MRSKVTPDTGEVRSVDEVTGGEKGVKLQRYDLIPVAPLEEVAKVFGKGAEKYEDRNWERGYAWSSSYASLQRHAQAFWDGESIDKEQERHHLGAVIFHAMALMEFELRGKGTDDRPRTATEYERMRTETVMGSGPYIPRHAIEAGEPTQRARMVADQRSLFNRREPFLGMPEPISWLDRDAKGWGKDEG